MPAKRSTNRKKPPRVHPFRRVPSFVGLRPSSIRSSRVKSHNRATGTRAELLLQKALKRVGLGYRVNFTGLPGKPDVVLPDSRVAVFCDGDFWHGRHWKSRQTKLKAGSNSGYWVAKIGYNILRDKRQKNALRRAGWLVVRFWESDVVRDPDRCAARIRELVRKRRSKPSKR